ncbi:PROTEIN putative-RELATED [Salix viminalis]|uniref:PROTEIN putative-RELATED n=1 Tax=Salix viminalis TaxID=40686 RepID=A0A9Q0SG54_SALVM|nr:PROTEIN putative-RELATED [Salix viminalis]KAJ6675575.1 PROTEIN putative-RELATED [Salix viminalis]
MSLLQEEETTNPNPNINSKTPPIPIPTLTSLDRKIRTLSSPELLSKERALKHATLIMKSRSNSPFASPRPVASPRSIPGRILGFHSYEPTGPDYTSFLSDEILLQVFRKVPVSHYVSNSLVCKRWLFIHGRLVQSIKVLDFGFVNSGRAFTRFPNLENIDIAHACIKMPRNSGILIARNNLSVYVGAKLLSDGFIEERDLLSSDLIDNGLELISKWYPNLRRIVVFGSSENGLLCVSSKCKMLQELELHCCGDMSLMGISGCRNLQVLKLIGCVDGFYNSVVSDIGLTILAQGCRRLVKLELCGCEGSYDGIKAIGQCCQMLEELTIRDHRMDGGWLAALSFCENLKTLRLQSCKSIDSSPGLLEHLGSCPTLEELHLQQCQLRYKQAVKALFLICKTVREIVLQNCWGLEDEAFASATVCRRTRLLSLEGCSLLTTGGLESVILNWKELERLTVISCNNVKDSEITPDLATLFSVLKELKWRPDSKSLLSAGLAGTGVGNKGGRFFKGLKV